MNVMLSGRPLLDNAVDTALFVGHENALAALDNAAANGFNVLVTGTPGSGKTSLLHRWQYAQRSAGHTTFFARVQGVTEPANILAAVIGEADPEEQNAAGHLDFDARKQLGRLSWALRAHTGSSEQQRVSVIVDDVSGIAGHTLFGQLRDELWELPVQWIVSASSSETATITMPPADAFFDTRVEVGELSRAQVKEMLTRRAGDSGGKWSTPVFEVVGGRPRTVLALARDAVSDAGELTRVPAGTLEALAARQQAIVMLGRPEAMLASELDRLGAAAASDEALLNALGWTRARAVQVLGRLESEHLVVSDDVRSDRGRPRKVYRLVPAREYQQHLATSRAGGAA